MTAVNVASHAQQFGLPKIDAALKSATYLGILAVLLAFGWFGHQTHWTFQYGAAHSGGDDRDHVSVKTERPATVTSAKVDIDQSPSCDWKITFPSENSFNLSGIATAPVEQKAIAERVRTTGVITYDERLTASLSARTTGTVWQVCKHVGETIHRGDVRVIVDATEVGQSKSEFLSALVGREAKSEALTNLESVGNGAIPQRQIREARVALREAKINLLNAEQKLVNLGFCIHADDFQELSDTDRAKRIQFLGLPDDMVQELDRSKTTSNLLPMRAVFDGGVLRHDVALGETAEAGKPILEIADTRRMWLKLDVPKEDASKLALGQQVTFNPDGIEKDLQGAITWISTEMNEHTRTLQIRAEVENPVVSSDLNSGQEVRLLRANTFGTGTITLKKNSSALIVPVSAVLHVDRQPMVFT